MMMRVPSGRLDSARTWPWWSVIERERVLQDRVQVRVLQPGHRQPGEARALVHQRLERVRLRRDSGDAFLQQLLERPEVAEGRRGSVPPAYGINHLPVAPERPLGR